MAAIIWNVITPKAHQRHIHLIEQSFAATHREGLFTERIAEIKCSVHWKDSKFVGRTTEITTLGRMSWFISDTQLVFASPHWHLEQSEARILRYCLRQSNNLLSRSQLETCSKSSLCWYDDFLWCWMVCQAPNSRNIGHDRLQEKEITLDPSQLAKLGSATAWFTLEGFQVLCSIKE